MNTKEVTLPTISNLDNLRINPTLFYTLVACAQLPAYTSTRKETFDFERFKIEVQEFIRLGYIEGEINDNFFVNMFNALATVGYIFLVNEENEPIEVPNCEDLTSYRAGIDPQLKWTVMNLFKNRNE